MWLYTMLKGNYDLKETLLDPESEKEVKHLNRVPWRGTGFEWQCDPKHIRALVREFGLVECTGKGTSLTRDEIEKSRGGEEEEEPR